MTHAETRFELADRRRLKPNPDNPKLITKEDVDKMVRLLQLHGFRDPVEARAEDGLVLAGHRRLLAADKLGLTRIPTIWHVGMSDEEAAAYTIAHTRSEKDVAWNRALLADQVSGLPEDLAAGLGFGETEFERLFDLALDQADAPADGDGADGDGDGDAIQAGLVAGETWVIGPVTFNVWKTLDNAGLLAAEKCIKRISKMLKAKAYLNGDESFPFEAVMQERRAVA